MDRTCVLALLPLFIGLAHSSWDIVVGEEKRLKFYNYGTLEYSEDVPADNDIISVTYDPVYDKMLFADYHDTNKSIYSYNLSTREIQRLVSRTTNHYIKYIVYDPVTELLFWKEGDSAHSKIYSFSLKPATSNEAEDGNVFVELNNYCRALAIDSCRGFIYWATDSEIERAAFDGSKREVLINGGVVARRGLAIDLKTQTMYWTQEISSNEFSIESADLNGNNKRRFYFIGRDYAATDLSISKDFIYWRSYDQRAILRLPKILPKQSGIEPIFYSNASRNFWPHQLTAANYKIKEQTLDIKSCEALKSLILDVEERHGSICHNYCFQGNCSITAERQPICSCNRGYSGERCEVDACHKHCLNGGICSLNEAEKPVCQCTANYQGERCDVSICKDYCIQGNCIVSSEGQPTCRCTAGYTGERCEVNACHGHCLNNGICSLNEEEKAVCQCTADYEGKRCDVATTHTGTCVWAEKTTQQILLEMKQVREELQCTMQLYSDKLDENAAKIQICEETMNYNQQNHDETISKSQTSNINF